MVERQLQGHKSAINCVAFNPKERTIASGDNANVIMIWNLKKTTSALKLQGHTAPVLDLSFSHKTNLLASASQDRSVRLWVPTYSGRTSDFRAHFSAVRSVDFSPDGETLVTGSDDKSVKLWSIEGTRKFITSMNQHTNWVRCTRFNHAGSLVGSCSDDRSAILWDVRDPKKPVQMLEDLDSSPNHLAFQPSQETVFAVAFSSGHVRIYDMRSPQHLLQKYNVNEMPVNQVAFHPTGHILLAACASGEIKVLDLLEGRPIYTLTLHKSSVTGVAFSGTGNTFASAGEDKQVVLWRANEGCVSPAPRTPVSASSRTPVFNDPRSPMPPAWKRGQQPSLARSLKNKAMTTAVSNEAIQSLEERVRRLEMLLEVQHKDQNGSHSSSSEPVPALEKRIMDLEQLIANNQPEIINNEHNVEPQTN